MKHQLLDSEAFSEELEHLRRELASKILRLTDKNPRLESRIPELTLTRWTTTTEKSGFLHQPSVCMIAQGAKRFLLGEDVYVYDPHHFLLTSVNLPVFAQIIEASEEKPYLGLMLKIDPKAIAQMLVDSDFPPERSEQTGRGMAVSKVTLPLLSAIIRLIDLLDTPQDIPILSPLIQREILYRLLISDQGIRLRQATMNQSLQIARAISWLKENYMKEFQVSDLASDAHMSPSTFHHHFRVLTAMSPLQFQKWIRLHEARRLMLAENVDAANAAYKVGYESPSQFNREYSRLFGAPPMKDKKNLSQLARV
ncbi:MAG: AraC family transcriptional regulator [bacterium]|nr:AraC family transcriptional regulator [bacterium]